LVMGCRRMTPSWCHLTARTAEILRYLHAVVRPQRPQRAEAAHAMPGGWCGGSRRSAPGTQWGLEISTLESLGLWESGTLRQRCEQLGVMNLSVFGIINWLLIIQAQCYLALPGRVKTKQIDTIRVHKNKILRYESMSLKKMPEKHA
jgi:hypothetical protein